MFVTWQKLMLALMLCVVIVLLSIWLSWGNVSIKTTAVTIRDSRIPTGFQGFIIAHVSDLHNTELGRGHSRLLMALRAANPDCIVVTGDLVDSRRTNYQTAMDWIRKAAEIAPIYYTTGNHEARIADFEQFAEQLRQAGVTVLRNAGTIITHNGNSLRLIGLDDPGFVLKNAPDRDAGIIANEALEKLMGQPDASYYTILLSHRPNLFQVYTANNVNLTLCGHAHGGQIRLPGIGGVLSPGQGFFPKYTEGVHHSENTTMVVSRGLGNSLFPLRINNRPELVVLTLKAH